jgi:competence ComEA-like helix-hairpin-helix protein
MTRTKTNGLSVEPAARLARLGPAHGYRLDGDIVHLNAMFTVSDPAAHGHAWSLQLWACPEAPGTALDILGHLVAEIALPPMRELADETEHLEISGFAALPSRPGSYAMVLALVRNPGRPAPDVHDFFVYPRREEFVQPCIAGTAGFAIDGSRVVVEVERIENRRATGNLSGTLALELWALEERYGGGKFQGAPLAGVAFDPVRGQWETVALKFDLPFNRPPAGEWNVVLMLREWTALGYVTRDFVNFDLPLDVPAPRPETLQVKPVTPQAKVPPAAVPAQPAGTINPPSAARETPAPAAAPTPARASAPSPSTVSVNTASKAELATIKGLPTKVAEQIISKRPFKNLDDLAKVKGMGAKLLAKLRARLRL